MHLSFAKCRNGSSYNCCHSYNVIPEGAYQGVLLVMLYIVWCYLNRFKFCEVVMEVSALAKLRKLRTAIMDSEIQWIVQLSYTYVL